MDVSYHLEWWLAQYMLNGCLLLWNLRTRSRLFPMRNSCTTHQGLQLCLPSPPSQILTLHAPTSLDNLEALEHLRSKPALFVFVLRLPSCTLSQILLNLQSQTRTPPPLRSLVQSPRLRGFQDLLSALPQALLQCLCLPPRQKSASLKAGEMGPFCAPPAHTVAGKIRCLGDGHLQ